MQKQNLDLQKRSRRGPKPLPTDETRTHCVSVRLNAVELATLDSQRGLMQRGEYLRVAALHCLPPVVPEINKNAWVELSRLSANLNQYQAAINAHHAPHQQIDIGYLSDQVAALRNDLLGQNESES